MRQKQKHSSTIPNIIGVRSAAEFQKMNTPPPGTWLDCRDQAGGGHLANWKYACSLGSPTVAADTAVYWNTATHRALASSGVKGDGWGERAGRLLFIPLGGHLAPQPV